MTRGSRIFRALGLLLLVSVIGGLAGLAALDLLGRLERLTVDARFDLRGTQPAPVDVVVVAFDNRTLRSLDVRPPVPRGVHARVIDRLDLAGARVVAFDYSLEQPSGDARADRRIVQALVNARAAVVDVVAPSSDGSVADLAGYIPFSDIEVRPGDGALQLDPEGVVRRFRSPPGTLDAFPVAAAKAFTGRRGIVVPPGALIDYPGPAGTVEQLSYVDVLRGEFRADSVRGRIALVGPTATVLGDTHRVPVDSTMTGPEIHAAAIATALDGFPLRELSAAAARRVVLPLGAVFALLLGIGSVLMRRVRRANPGGVLLDTPGPVGAAVVGVTLMAAWLAAAQIAFNHGTVVPLVAGLAAILAAAVLSVLLALSVSRRERRRVRERFAAADAPVRQRVLASAGRSRAVTASDIISGYTIESQLGGGAMGAVWSAKQARLDRDVAIKVILAKYAADPYYRRRFVAEAFRAAAISHPHVIPVIDAGDSDGVLFIAMVKIVGTDLNRAIRNVGALEAKLAVRVLDPVASALDHAYTHHDELLHRDVKPSNILIPTESPAHPYVLDFGVAMTTAEAVRQGRPEGTLPYLAPERWVGGEGRAADVYALAATLYECLTGCWPFLFRSPDELRRAHEASPRPVPTDRRPDLPAAMNQVIATGMAVDPAERYPTATELTRAAAAAIGIDFADPAPVREPVRFSRPAGPTDVPLGSTEIAG